MNAQTHTHTHTRERAFEYKYAVYFWGILLLFIAMEIFSVHAGANGAHAIFLFIIFIFLIYGVSFV